MAILVISTQCEENYAAHNDDYVAGVSADHWKMKGGHEYKVKVDFDKDYEWAEVYVDRVLEKVMPQIGEDNDYYKEYVISWSLEDDDYLSWYEKSQLEYEGKIHNPEPVIEYKEAA